MNRTTIRGVTAGAVAATALVAVVAGPAIANGAESQPQLAPPQAAMQWRMPGEPVHPKAAARHRHRHHHRQGSTGLTGSPQDVARALVLRQGWSEAQWTCLDELWTRESDWETYATNGSSGAYGIPQALPASKMASAGADWRTNPVTQIRWGISYIASDYGTPCAALSHSSSYGYY